MSDGAGSALAYLIGGAILLVLVVLFIIYVVMPVLAVLDGAGLLWGGYQAVSNYVLAFRQQVRPERVQTVP